MIGNLVQFSPQLLKIKVEISELWVVISEAVRGIEVNNSGDSFRMFEGNRTEFLTTNRMADQYGPLDLESSENRQKILAEPISAITIGRVT